MMIREAPAMTVRQNLGELLNEVQYRGDSVLITKGGKAVAALIDIGLFERLRRLDEDFARMREELAESFSDRTEAQVDALIDEVVTQTRKRSRQR